MSQFQSSIQGGGLSIGDVISLALRKQRLDRQRQIDQQRQEFFARQEQQEQAQLQQAAQIAEQQNEARTAGFQVFNQQADQLGLSVDLQPQQFKLLDETSQRQILNGLRGAIVGRKEELAVEQNASESQRAQLSRIEQEIAARSKEIQEQGGSGQIAQQAQDQIRALENRRDNIRAEILFGLEGFTGQVQGVRDDRQAQQDRKRELEQAQIQRNLSPYKQIINQFTDMGIFRDGSAIDPEFRVRDPFTGEQIKPKEVFERASRIAAGEDPSEFLDFEDAQEQGEKEQGDTPERQPEQVGGVRGVPSEVMIEALRNMPPEFIASTYGKSEAEQKRMIFNWLATELGITGTGEPGSRTRGPVGTRQRPLQSAASLMERSG